MANPSEQVGRSARQRAPRSAHASWEAAPERVDAIATLERQAETRTPELVPVRYGRMARSPFAFLRGAAAIMAADLAATAVTGLDVQLCGDAHLANFGGFAAPDRSLVFDLNDFDETLPGPWEWDVKRLAASFAIAGRDRGLDAAARRDVVVTATRAYREAMRTFAAMRTIDVWYARLDIERTFAEWGRRLDARSRKGLDRAVAKARRKNSLRALSKLTYEVDGEPRIVSDPPLIVPIEDTVAPAEREGTEAFMHGIIRSYRRTLSGDRRSLLERFRYVHSARKVVGVGSVGTRAWIILLLGRDNEDPLLLQGKEAEASVLEPALGDSAFANHGQRVVEGQRLTQAASDIMLGWLSLEDPAGVRRDFYIRQLWDAKGSALVEAMEPRAMRVYADLCGWTLARSHARSGDPVAIASYLGHGDAFDRALATFAEAYAEQNERDYDALANAAASGRIAIETGL